MTLSAFVSYLADKNMIDVSKLKDDTDEGFENRLKVQKYVYMAKHFGFDLGYRYNIHIYGPYSVTLSHDYHKELDLENLPSPSAPSALKEGEFLSALRDKSIHWLEIAATILYERKLYGGITHAQLYNIKPDHTPEFIDSVYEDIANLDIR